MKVIDNKSKCTGCQACKNICPKQCIAMETDSEGFLYPVIDETSCSDCGLCKAICSDKCSKNEKGIAFACINTDKRTRLKSSSGGVFTLLAEYVINKNGVVFGAAFDQNLNVQHIIADNTETLEKLRGSKYVQSDISDTFKQAEKLLKDGKTVLFSGTPCQISGLKSFLRKDYDNLITQDIICHGVPSPKIWQSYLAYLGSVHNKKINKTGIVSFRNKDKSWKHYSVSIPFTDNSAYTKSHHDDLFMKAFLKDLCLRPSCYQCPSKSEKRESDITLADFWGIENILPEMSDDKGTSLVLVNSKKGRMLFNSITDKMELKQIDFDTAVKYNPSISKSAKLPKERKKFMHIAEHDFYKAVKLCTKTSIIRRFIWKFKNFIHTANS